MTVRTRDDPQSAVPAGLRGIIVWGPHAEVRQWLATTAGIEWMSRPKPHGGYVMVRVGMRQQLQRVRPAPARRVAAVPWWRQPEKVMLAGFAGGVVLGAAGLAVWLLVSLVKAAFAWLAENWPLVVAVLFVAALAALLLRRKSGGGSSGGGVVVTGGCTGIHCPGCRHH